MLYTPMLPEAASGTLEPRHVVVPLRLMCPHAELLLGRATALDEDARTVHVVTEDGDVDVRYEKLVVALGAVARTLPIPGLAEHGLGFKSPRRRDLPPQPRPPRARGGRGASPEQTERHLTFVFVGAGYAGVEALAELSDLVRDALRYYPTPEATRRSAGCSSTRRPKILAEIPDAARRVRRPPARRAAGSTSGSRRRSSRWTPTAAASPTARGSRPRRSSGRPG